MLSAGRLILIHQSSLNPPDRASTISLNPPDRATTISRLITQSIVVQESVVEKTNVVDDVPVNNFGLK